MSIASASALKHWDWVIGDQRAMSQTAAGRVAGRGAWRVVRTGARREKIVARQCRAVRITCFLPTVRVARVYGEQTCLVEVPLFAGYLFAQADEAALRAADDTRSIREVVDVPQPAIGWQLLSLARALDHDLPLVPSTKLANGRRVEVRSGLLTGVQGFVEHLTAPSRLVLQIDALGAAFSTPITGMSVALVDG